MKKSLFTAVIMALLATASTLFAIHKIFEL
jgi:hypothetical protein